MRLWPVACVLYLPLVDYVRIIWKLNPSVAIAHRHYNHIYITECLIGILIRIPSKIKLSLARAF